MLRRLASLLLLQANFTLTCSLYGLPAPELLHVGDSYSQLLGPRQEGASLQPTQTQATGTAPESRQGPEGPH